MANTPTETPSERVERLRTWLLRLVALMLEHDGPLAAALRRTVAGREAVVQLDDAAVRLTAVEADDVPLHVTIDPAPEHGPRQFVASADALRDVIAGRALLDAAIVDGRIAVKAQLPDLLAVHDLVMRLLCAGPQRRALRELWTEFDAEWPRRPVECGPLDGQRPRHGYLRERVPPDVLLVLLDNPVR